MLRKLFAKATYANVAATIALIIAVGGGAFAVGAIPDGRGNINACYVTKGRTAGTMRLLVKGTKCRRGETKVSWSQKGRPGDTGPPGQGGQAGQAGLPGQDGQPGPPNPNAANSDLLDNLDSTGFLQTTSTAGGDLGGPFSSLQIQPNAVGTNEVDGSLTGADVSDASGGGLTGDDIRENSLVGVSAANVDAHSVRQMFFAGDPGNDNQTSSPFGDLTVTAACNTSGTPDDVTVTATTATNDAALVASDDDSTVFDADWDTSEGAKDFETTLQIAEGKLATLIYRSGIAGGGAVATVHLVATDTGVGTADDPCLVYGDGVFDG